MMTFSKLLKFVTIFGPLVKSDQLVCIYCIALCSRMIENYVSRQDTKCG